jgi:Tfp pilus assembly protein PilO
MSKRAKIQIIVLLVLAVGFGSYFWYTSLYRPILIQKREKAAELQKLKDTLERAKAQAARRVSLEQEYQELQEQWEVVETLLPRERDMADFIQRLHTIKGKVDATIERVTPLPPEQVDFYMENPYEVEMLTTYHGLGNFFSHVANLPIIVDVSDLDILMIPKKPDLEEKETEVLTPTISSRFVLSTYSFSEEAELGQGQERQDGQEEQE